MVNLYPHQQTMIDQVRDEMRRHKAVLLQSATGCHAAGTEILMFDGSVKKVEDIKVGEKIMGDDSTPRIVLETKSGTENLYRIIPKKGESFVVNESHILSLKSTERNSDRKNSKGYESRSKKKGSVVNISVRDYFEKTKTFKHLYKLYRVPVSFQKKELQIDPYHLGILLGDGSMIRQLNITTADVEISDAFKEFCKKLNANFRTDGKKNNKAYTIYLYETSGAGGNKPKTRARGALESLGLWGRKSHDKFIPEIYKTSSFEDRLDLLAGLIDTDGSMSGKGFDFISKSRFLSEDVVFVARSLGLCAVMNSCKKTCQTGAIGAYFRVSISGDTNIVPTRLMRKKASPRTQKKNPLFSGFIIEKIGVGEFFGFSVDKNNLYVTSDFFVHHNSGKSVMAAAMIAATREKGRKSCFVVPRVELLKQMSNTFRDFDIPHSFIAQGHTLNSHAHTHIASLGTLINRLDKIKPDVVFCDESHFGGGQIDKVIRHFRDKGIWVVGLSATPARNDNFGMGDWYSSMVTGPSIRWLIDNKFLSEYALVQPSKTIAKGTIGGDPVEEWLIHAGGRKTICYCKDKQHGLFTADQFNRAGIPAAFMESNTPPDERRRIIEAFAADEIKIITNVYLLQMGFDLAAQIGRAVNVRCMLDLQFTQSLTAQMQKNGRALRYDAGGHAVIIDLVGNSYAHNHGYPCADRNWVLDKSDVHKRDVEYRERSLSLIRCKKCFRPSKIGPMFCPHCGEKYFVDSKTLRVVDGKLIVVTPDMLRQDKIEIETGAKNSRMEVGRASTMEDLHRIALERGYRSGWVFKQAQLKGIKS